MNYQWHPIPRPHGRAIMSFVSILERNDRVIKRYDCAYSCSIFFYFRVWPDGWGPCDRPPHGGIAVSTTRRLATSGAVRCGPRAGNGRGGLANVAGGGPAEALWAVAMKGAAGTLLALLLILLKMQLGRGLPRSIRIGESPKGIFFCQYIDECVLPFVCLLLFV